MRTFADEMSAGSVPRSSLGFFGSPVGIASAVIISAGITFFGVKALVNSDIYNNAPNIPNSYEFYEVTDLNEYAEPEPSSTAEPETVYEAETTATTTMVRANPQRFERAHLHWSIKYPVVHIDGYSLPLEYGDGLLDPEAVFWLINEIRADNGLAPLQRGDARLGNAAWIRADEILEDFSQTRPDGTSYRTVFLECGVDFEFCLESVGYGQYTAEQIVKEWLESPPNKSNLLNTECTTVFIVCEIGDDNVPVWAFEAISPGSSDS